MDLQKTFNATLDAIEKRSSTLDQKEREVNDLKTQINKQKEELDQQIKDFEAEKASLQNVKDIQAQKELNNQKVIELAGVEIELKREKNRLKKYENSLVEVKNNQDKREQELTDAANVQADREINYKKKLEADFLEGVKRRFLQ